MKDLESAVLVLGVLLFLSRRGINFLIIFLAYPIRTLINYLNLSMRMMGFLPTFGLCYFGGLMIKLVKPGCKWVKIIKITK
jgi:hypothetical protein